MKDTRIKICGITTPKDAEMCHALGADHLGLIFAESKRRITPGKAAEIRGAVPRASLVGVFMDSGIDEVSQISRACLLNGIQLHGAETPDYVRELHDRTRLPVIKAFRPQSPPLIEDARTYGAASYLLLDLEKGGSRNGAARNGLWEKAEQMVRQGFRLFLAGGLTPDNVRQALDRVKPFGVDVSSGVEQEPGVKDQEAVRRFIAEVRGCTPAEE